MKQKFELSFCIITLAISALVLYGMLWQSGSFARIINYSGIVRGVTQRLVKEELYGRPNDVLITYLDDVLYDLSTGEGAYDISQSNHSDYQLLLQEVDTIWSEIKAEITLYRSGNSTAEHLYQLSQYHFEKSDQLVLCAEQNADETIALLRNCFTVGFVLALIVLILLNRGYRNALDKNTSIDVLTGLYNRTGFCIAAERRMRHTPDTRYMMVMFDIDNFKHINHVFSYAKGDQVLMEIATALQRWRGDACISARLDADDFIILTKYSSTVIEQLEIILQGAIEELHLPETFSGTQFTYGAYEVVDRHEMMRTIIDHAFTAHKNAKSSEGRSVLWYDQKLAKKVEKEQYLVAHFAQAVTEKEFKLYLQPQLNLKTLDIIGAEALVRWRLPNGEMVFPDTFIPLFEGNGLIIQLDYYMLEQTCAYLDQQRELGNILRPIAVNFSRVTLCQPNFCHHIAEIVDQHQLPHHYIEVEVLENAFNDVCGNIINMLTELQQAGFHISMDDFGAGYSSLSALGDLPVQTVKLDRQFLWGINNNDKRKAIISSFVEMAHRLDMRVICEGVEDASHVEFLQQIDCACAQGYYFSRPVPKEDFTVAVEACLSHLSCPFPHP